MARLETWQAALWILGSSILFALIGFVGLITLCFPPASRPAFSRALLAFASGSLVGGSIFTLIPESLETIGQEWTIPLVGVGFMFFYFLEIVVNYFLDRSQRRKSEALDIEVPQPRSPLVGPQQRDISCPPPVDPLPPSQARPRYPTCITPSLSIPVSERIDQPCTCAECAPTFTTSEGTALSPRSNQPSLPAPPSFGAPCCCVLHDGRPTETPLTSGSTIPATTVCPAHELGAGLSSPALEALASSDETKEPPAKADPAGPRTTCDPKGLPPGGDERLPHEAAEQKARSLSAMAWLNIIGDSLHNFLDGVAVGSTFVVDLRTGILVWLVAAMHEIPQELGDFGWSVRKAATWNVLAQCFFILGAAQPGHLNGRRAGLLRAHHGGQLPVPGGLGHAARGAPHGQPAGRHGLLGLCALGGASSTP
ncbi:putative solute carrier family 39 (zinc transporter); member 6 [Paratrimastix pyriformis]|uniref:Solute carrier family 39 (Zinc transporter) n=1 Tax=Paratrimastix pyriformis TaxID=342808 RepID=A0ABQ8UQY6_9EUKA|nr:putative solute carrier family 39 (zinc transporter); member 6 [Paratrimastix pyriformis]